VLTAGSAGEALAIVDQRGAPDVVVLDVLMPGMTGFELLPALRSIDGMEELPAIFLSGRVEEHHIRAGRSPRRSPSSRSARSRSLPPAGSQAALVPK
jgi:CheY-like chemotaxis protein